MKGGLMFRHYGLFIGFMALFIVSTFAYGDMAVSRDPTEPSNDVADISKARETQSITSFFLEAILISGDNKLAIVNNHILKVGDVLGDSKIKSIDNYTVTLVGDEGEVVLHLFGSPIKETSK